MATSYQDNRSVTVDTPFGKDVLLLSSLSAVERLSEPFQYELLLLSEKGDLDPDKILGKKLAVTLKLAGSGLKARHFHGLVTHFSQTDFGIRFHTYRAVVRPWFWFLTRTADCRIFQNMTVPDIFEKVCRDAGFADFRIDLKENYEPWEYCVQYRETDFNFLSRLLEQEGIFYFFEHSGDKHEMVLADDVARLGQVAGYEKVPYFPESGTPAQRERDHLSSWSFEKSFHPGLYATLDYNFEAPTPLVAGKSSVSRKHDAAKFEIFDYPAETQKFDSAALERIAKVRVQELQVPQMVARGSGDAAGLTTGKLFQLEGYPRGDLNIRYLVTSTSINLSADNYQSGAAGSVRGGRPTLTFAISIEAADAREPYRPARVTPKPVVQGAQTAVVVGTKGEEIYTDEYARVKVQFHWDRYGKLDENSSCWVRVATTWAGKNWGAIRIPRIGQEVVVSFLEGDPDQPLVIGSLYNGANKPPYALPANRTQSGVKSRSSLDGTPDNCNEIRFEDKKGSEHLLIHAEKDQIIEVENDETHTVGHDRQKTVENNETISIGKNRSATIGENESVSVGKNRTENVSENESVTIGKDQALRVSQNRTQSIGKNETVTIGENRRETVGKNEDVNIGENRTHSVAKRDMLSVGKQLIIDAGDEVSIKTGSASITMKKDGTITIKGKNITLDGSGKINIKASQDVVIKGMKVTQN